MSLRIQPYETRHTGKHKHEKHEQRHATTSTCLLMFTSMQVYIATATGLTHSVGGMHKGELELTLAKSRGKSIICILFDLLRDLARGKVNSPLWIPPRVL